MAEQKTNQQPEQDLSQQSKVRREKLAALQAEGRLCALLRKGVLVRESPQK